VKVGLFWVLAAGAVIMVTPSLAADLPRGPIVKAPSPAPVQGWTLCRKPAAEPEDPKFPDMPGGDLFGLTNPTDVGSPGDCGIAFEFTGRAGKADGSYLAGTLKTQLGATVAENLAVAISPFFAYHRIRGVTDLDDINRAQFDGLSGEFAYRFVERSATNRFAATFSMEGRWARVNPTSGVGIEGYAVEFKLFVDAVVVPDRLYAAFNVVYVPAVQKLDGDPLGVWMRASGTSVSGALTYQINERLFVGVESHLFTEFEGLTLQHQVGQGLFVGPTMLVKLSEATALNVFWTPQVWGRAVGADRRLDLDNFERHQFRAKLAASF
jgi:hypothetical protein